MRERLDEVVSRLAAVEGLGGTWSFELLQLRRDSGVGAAAQLALVEEVAKHGAAEPAVARTMERVGRDANALPVVANALAALAEHTPSTAAAVGALWAEAVWLEHAMPGPSVLRVLREIRERDPEDRAAIDAVLRVTSALVDVGSDERAARRSALAALPPDRDARARRARARRLDFAPPASPPRARCRRPGARCPAARRTSGQAPAGCGPCAAPVAPPASSPGRETRHTSHQKPTVRPPAPPGRASPSHQPGHKCRARSCCRSRRSWPR